MKSGLILLIVGLVIGLAWPDVPETRVITTEVPTVATKVERHTEYVTQELPLSCHHAIELVRGAVKGASDVARIGSNIETNMEDVTSDQLGDPKAVLRHQSFLQRATEALDIRLIEAIEAKQILQDALQVCQEDVNKSE